MTAYESLGLKNPAPVKRVSDANTELLYDLEQCLGDIKNHNNDHLLSVEPPTGDDPEYSLDRHGNVVRNEIPAGGQGERLGVFENVPDKLLKTLTGDIIVVEYRFSTRDSQKPPQFFRCAQLRPQDGFTRVNLKMRVAVDPVIKDAKGKKRKDITNTNDVVRVALFLTRHDAQALQLAPPTDKVAKNEEKQEYQQWIDDVFKSPSDLILAGTSAEVAQQLGIALTQLTVIESDHHSAAKALNNSMLEWIQRGSSRPINCKQLFVDPSDIAYTTLQTAMTKAGSQAEKTAETAAEKARETQQWAAGLSYKDKTQLHADELVASTVAAAAKALADAKTLKSAIAAIESHADGIKRQTATTCNDVDSQQAPHVARIDFPIEAVATDNADKDPDLLLLQTLARTLASGLDPNEHDPKVAATKFNDAVTAFNVAWAAFKEQHDGKFEKDLQITDDQNVVVGAVSHAAARTSWVTSNPPAGRAATEERMLFGAFDLPAASPANHTVLLQMGTVAAAQTPLTIVHGNALVTAWATHVSTRQDADLSFFWVEGQNTQPDPASALNVLFSGLGGKYTISASTLGVSNNVSTLQTDSIRHMPEPLAEFTSVARTTRMLPGSAAEGMIADRIYTVTVCLGSCADPTAKSDGSAKSASVATSLDPNGSGLAQAQAHIVSPPAGGFTVLGALTYDFDCTNPDHSGQFYDNEWRPQAIGNSAETFQLRRVAQPAQSFTFSFIATLLAREVPSGRWGGGLGLTWITGGGTSASFKQYTLDGVWSPQRQSLINRMFFVFGMGVRLVDQVAAPSQIGDVVTVQRSGGAAPMAPSVSTKTGAELVIHLGLAVNLQIVTDAIANLVKGGSK